MRRWPRRVYARMLDRMLRDVDDDPAMTWQVYGYAWERMWAHVFTWQRYDPGARGCAAADSDAYGDDEEGEEACTGGGSSGDYDFGVEEHYLGPLDAEAGLEDGCVLR